MHFNQLLPFVLAALPLATAQLSGKVGPLTSVASKSAKKTCNVTNYGAKADKSTDLGPAITKAFADCKAGGTIVIPSGDYALETFVTLNGGSAWALQIDGIIYRTGTGGGNMIAVTGASDVEIFSSTGKGAIQGNGYQIHPSLSGARILRLIKTQNFSVHDLVLVDAPAFHFTMDTCKNGEVYNMAIRGGDSGGLDGVDVWSDNVWIHDVMVTNRDECVTVKSPAHNILIEDIYCNQSGGSAFGSLSTGTDISDITYRNIYTWSSNQMMMIKSNGGSGTVKNVLLQNFIGHGNAYSLNIDQYWSSQKTGDGTGVKLSNITFDNWKGTAANGAQRAPIKLTCSDGAPCTDITVKDVDLWTDTGSKVLWTCRSAYGSGACLKSGAGSASYAATTTTITAAPAGYSAAKMPDDLKSGFGKTVSIPIPAIPTSYFPGHTPRSKVSGAAAAATKAARSIRGRARSEW